MHILGPPISLTKEAANYAAHFAVFDDLTSYRMIHTSCIGHIRLQKRVHSLIFSTAPWHCYHMQQTQPAAVARCATCSKCSSCFFKKNISATTLLPHDTTWHHCYHMTPLLPHDTTATTWHCYHMQQTQPAKGHIRLHRTHSGAFYNFQHSTMTLRPHAVNAACRRRPMCHMQHMQLMVFFKKKYGPSPASFSFNFVLFTSQINYKLKKA